MADEECAGERYPGYEKLADYMAQEGSSFAIFRKFGQLSALTLLGLQEDLAGLTEKFNSSEKSSNRLLYSFSAMRVKHEEHEAQEEGVDHNKDCKYCLLLKIREKLKEYRVCSALLMFLLPCT